MARKVPASPAQAEAALDAALARAPRPALPPGLTARIVAQATALPQLPADGSVEPHEEAPRVSAKVIPFHTARAEAVADQQPVKARRGLLVGGFAAIAATIAAVVLIGQSGQQVGPTSAPAPMMAQRENAPAPIQAAPAAAPETRLASAPAAHSQAPAKAASVLTSPSEPAPLAAPSSAPEPQLAATVPPAPRESAGPSSDPSPRPNPRGLMGPPAPQQGWAFSGGAPGGGTLPGGQSLPSQTTGSAPPPPPPPGH